MLATAILLAASFYLPCCHGSKVRWALSATLATGLVILVIGALELGFQYGFTASLGFSAAASISWTWLICRLTNGMETAEHWRL